MSENEAPYLIALLAGLVGCFVVALCIAWLIWVLSIFASMRSGK
jgi:hypothetical protein